MISSTDYRAYATHLRDQHQAIHEAAHSILQHIAAGEQTLAFEELHQFRRMLEQHFREEEEGGCLEEAVARAPYLGEESQRLEREHPVLLRRFDAILQQARTSFAGNLAFVEDFREFVELLAAHEAAEDRVLQHGFQEATPPE
jgi:uncharacterized tellurite resistance protein B-like protein